MNATPPPAGSSKQQWRDWAKTTRVALPDASDAVCAHLERFIREWNATHTDGADRLRTVVAYKAFGSEVRLEALVAALPDLEWLTTRTEPDGQLSLHPFSSATQRNRLGVLEPPADAPEVPAHAVDAILVPGLVFDATGGRLGYGKGFYDRLLPHLRPGVPTVGITSTALVVPALPLEASDVRMTHLATETGVQRTC